MVWFSSAVFVLLVMVLEKRVSKYQPKSYQLILFDKNNVKLKVISYVNFLTADHEGKAFKKLSGGTFVIMQVLKNSEIPHDIHDYYAWVKRTNKAKT